MSDVLKLIPPKNYYTAIITMAAEEQPVKGVRINCLGDQQKNGKPKFEAVDIPITHSIFTKHSKSDIGARVGLPIFIEKVSAIPLYSSGTEIMNQSATFLNLCLDPHAQFGGGVLGFGWAPWKWQNDVGSVVIVRQDKKPLSPFHVEALAKYAQNEVAELLQIGGEEETPKEEILGAISKLTFSIAYMNLRRKMQEEARSAEEKAYFNVRHPHLV
ncbi:hypothetical protein EJ08DRAFT_332571 [Tothia fuscella]|uniref:Uncharacterized protein n=1 Tax=Tothia fuscella TaxID=1048955 RepID=A0A9P4NN79_9PEZI|nr:hypothetical protein EJ08DRAFT_332571 [Tothia fuscella]